MAVTATNEEVLARMGITRIKVRNGLNFDVWVHPEDDSISITLIGNGTIALLPGTSRQNITIECRRSS